MNKEIQFILYNLPNDEGAVQGVVRDETIWMTQKAMAQLFGVNVPAISKHLQNVYEDGELDKTATVSKMEIVQQEGTRSIRREVDMYNLDAIISVGYRVNSAKATRFWPVGYQGETAFGIDSDFDKAVREQLKDR